MHMEAGTSEVLREVARERNVQYLKWGEQDHPDVWDETPKLIQRAREYAANAAANFQQVNSSGQPVDWTNILLEEVWEAIAEEGPDRLREELIQVAAVAVAWVEAIDRRVA